MRVLTDIFPDVFIIELTSFKDDRGYFFESFQTERYRTHKIETHFVQDNFSHSKKNVLRGLHFQIEKPQGKLIFVGKGKICDVIVDIRPHSATFKKYMKVELSETNHKQIYIPPGYAHGFCVLSEGADVMYKCTEFYHPELERGIVWNDPDLAIDWSVENPILSPKDAVLPRLKDIIL